MPNLKPYLYASVLLLAGCASGFVLQTRSGKPEARVFGRTQPQVIEAVAAMCANAGWSVESQTTSTVTCTGQAAMMMEALMTTRGGSVIERSQFLVSKLADGHLVTVTSAAIESTNGFGGKQLTPINLNRGAAAQNYQYALDLMAGQLNEQPR